jgi:nitrogenase molybdenum-iron protein beta chain
LCVQNYKFDSNINYGCSMRGAWRALQCMGNDIAIVIHGPKGCNNEFKLDYTSGIAKTYCTDMNEKDVITGGIDKLKKIILDIDKSPDISLIVILTTCTSELIGEDIDGLVNNLQNQVSKKFLVLHTSGISGMVQSEGHNMVISDLAKKFIKIKPQIKNSINYIGYSWPWDFRDGRDLSEL